MDIQELPVEGYEKVVRARDPQSGLHAVIAVHDTTLGPALGGLRMWPYASEEAAVTDVLRLAAGMTYKSAIARTGFGGGKAVLIGEPARKSEALYLAMGRFIDSLGGCYITAEDVNTTIADLAVIRRTTRHVTGLSRESGSSGNPSPYTARGVFLGIEACLEHVFGSPSARGRRVAIQGVGAVGSTLARELAAAGAKVFAADMRADRLRELERDCGVEPVTEAEILGLDCDVLAPCALGGVLDDRTIQGLRCRIVAGAANNQLMESRHADLLRGRGILYAPDYVINAGGVINIACELLPGGYDEAASLMRIRRIPDALREVFALSQRENVSTAQAAELLARRILSAARAAKGR